ncbi:hypothetical protein ACFUJR_32625 [Streptomyces sp. NPDC057271]|uniref:hypothetical protein n=1 Tax=unclassified Streptomyces TaxID=2593676 RepID=UPI0036370850
MSSKTMARIGVLLGGVTASVGVGIALDLAAALMTGGIVFAVWCLFLADVDTGEGGRKAGGS